MEAPRYSKPVIPDASIASDSGELIYILEFVSLKDVAEDDYITTGEENTVREDTFKLLLTKQVPHQVLLRSARLYADLFPFTS